VHEESPVHGAVLNGDVIVSACLGGHDETFAAVGALVGALGAASGGSRTLTVRRRADAAAPPPAASAPPEKPPENPPEKPPATAATPPPAASAPPEEPPKKPPEKPPATPQPERSGGESRPDGTIVVSLPAGRLGVSFEGGETRGTVVVVGLREGCAATGLLEARHASFCFVSFLRRARGAQRAGAISPGTYFCRRRRAAENASH
jgi:hypothetical protein